MSVTKVVYKQQEVNINDIIVTWTDIFGDYHTGSIEDYASDYASEQVGIAEAGEAW